MPSIQLPQSLNKTPTRELVLKYVFRYKTAKGSSAIQGQIIEFTKVVKHFNGTTELESYLEDYMIKVDCGGKNYPYILSKWIIETYQPKESGSINLYPNMSSSTSELVELANNWYQKQNQF
jgi:hypothetical protein